MLTMRMHILVRDCITFYLFYLCCGCRTLHIQYYRKGVPAGMSVRTRSRVNTFPVIRINIIGNTTQ